MKPGAKWKLFVPPELAYGANPRPGIPGNSLLIFDVELAERQAQAGLADAAAAEARRAAAAIASRPPHRRRRGTARSAREVERVGQIAHGRLAVRGERSIAQRDPRQGRRDRSGA